MMRFLIALCAALSIGVADARAASIQLVPASQTVSPGDAISLDLLVSGLGGAVVGDFDFDISYDSTRLALDGVALTGALGSMASGEALDFSLGLVSPGLLNLAIVSTLSAAQLDALQADPILLATLAFTVGALPAGQSTTVGFAAVNALGNATGGGLPIAGLDGATLTALDQLPPPPTTVPEPVTGVMCLTGLSTWLGLKRARRRQSPTRPFTNSPTISSRP